MAKRPDVLVIESGEIELPVDGKLRMRDIKLPQNVVFACMAETIVLVLEGRFEVFTIGRDTEWQKVKEIYKPRYQAWNETGRYLWSRWRFL